MAYNANQEEWRKYLLGGEPPAEGQGPIELTSSQPQVTSVRDKQYGGYAGARGRLGGPETPQAPGPTAPKPPAMMGVVAAEGDFPSLSVPVGQFPKTGTLYGTKGTTSERLLSPGAQAIKEIPGAIGGIYSQFESQAGPQGQTFESRKGAETLGTFIGSGEQREPAFGLVGASYSGPMGLPRDALAPVSERIGGELTRGTALRTGGGSMALLSEAVPGLTPGMLRYEGKEVFSDPTYRRRAAQQLEEASRLLGTLAEREGAARTYAKTRMNEEAEISRRSRDFATERQGRLLADPLNRANAEIQRRMGIEDAWRKFQTSGDIRDLYAAGIDMKQASGSPWDQALFDSPYASQLAAAKKAYQNILSKYGMGSYNVSPVITESGNTWYGAKNWEGYPGPYPTPVSTVDETLRRTGGMLAPTPRVPAPPQLPGATPGTTSSVAATPRTAAPPQILGATSTPSGSFISPALQSQALPTASVLRAATARAPVSATTQTPTQTQGGFWNPDMLNGPTGTQFPEKGKLPAPVTAGTATSTRNTGTSSYSPTTGTTRSGTVPTPTAPSVPAASGTATSSRLPYAGSGSFPDDVGNKIIQEQVQKLIDAGLPVDIRLIPNLPQYLQKRIRDQQFEIEALFGERGVASSPGGSEEFKGLYSPYFYEGAGVPQWYEPGAITPYVNYVSGNMPTPENMITQAEVDQLNRIAELLSLQQQYSVSPEAYQAPWVTQNPEGYKAEEERRFTERLEKLAGAEKGWRSQVSAAHKKAGGSGVLGDLFPWLA